MQVVEELPVVRESAEQQHVPSDGNRHVASSRLRGGATRAHLSPLHGVWQRGGREGGREGGNRYSLRKKGSYLTVG